MTSRRACLGAENPSDGRRIARVEFVPSARRFDDRRPGEPEPHAGHEGNPFRGTCQHRRAAEDVGNAGDQHRNAGGAQIEKRRQRAGKRPFGSVGFMQPHAPGRRENDHSSRTLGASELEQAPQRIGMIRARAAAQEPLVLRCDEDMRTFDRRTGDDDAVIVLGRDTPTREMRRGPRRVERVVHRPYAPSVGDGGDACRGRQRAQCDRRGGTVGTHGYRRGWCVSSPKREVLPLRREGAKRAGVRPMSEAAAESPQ